ncbi:MAG: hypothetical protein WD552_00825 [Candidatus Paceibacterota bacterium]
MSRIPIKISDILHCFNRGVLKTDIYNSDHDRWRFLEILRYKNNNANIHRWQKDVSSISSGHDLPWPHSWRSQEALVQIDGYILMNNHYHLILTEILEGGISSFMQKLGNTYVGYMKSKYNREERMFSGPYKAVKVLDDDQIRMLFVYVLVKNSFECYPGGVKKAVENFDEAFKESRRNPFSSLGEIMGDREPLISSNSTFSDLFGSPKEFKEFSKHQMHRRQAFFQEVDDIKLES